MVTAMSSDEVQGEASSQQRTALLRAALGLLQEEGAAGLRLRSVAAAAGCSTTGVYTWFGGKNGLVEALFIEGFERFGSALRTGQHERSPVAEVRALAHRYRAWALESPTHYQIMFGGLVPDFRPSAAAATFSLTTFDILVDAVRAAVDAGELADDEPVAVAFHLWAGIHGYVELELTQRCGIVPIAPERLFDRGLELFLSGVTADGRR